MDVPDDKTGSPDAQLAWAETTDQVTTASNGGYVYELLVEPDGLCTLVVSEDEDDDDSDRVEHLRTQHRSVQEAKEAAADWNRSHPGA